MMSIQNTRDLQAQISDGITMDIMPSQSLALTQQLDHLRWTNDMLFTETLGNTWCGNQVRFTTQPPLVFWIKKNISTA